MKSSLKVFLLAGLGWGTVMAVQSCTRAGSGTLSKEDSANVAAAYNASHREDGIVGATSEGRDGTMNAFNLRSLDYMPKDGGTEDNHSYWIPVGDTNTNGHANELIKNYLDWWRNRAASPSLDTAVKSFYFSAVKVKKLIDADPEIALLRFSMGLHRGEKNATLIVSGIDKYGKHVFYDTGGVKSALQQAIPCPKNCPSKGSEDYLPKP